MLYEVPRGWIGEALEESHRAASAMVHAELQRRSPEPLPSDLRTFMLTHAVQGAVDAALLHRPDRCPETPVCLSRDSSERARQGLDPRVDEIESGVHPLRLRAAMRLHPALLVLVLLGCGGSASPTLSHAFAAGLHPRCEDVGLEASCISRCLACGAGEYGPCAISCRVAAPRLLDAAAPRSPVPTRDRDHPEREEEHETGVTVAQRR